jgi:type III pantothenate kinase
MNLCIDIGNSRIKTGLFRDDKLVANAVLADKEEIFELIENQHIDHCILSSTAKLDNDFVEKLKTAIPDFIEFSHTTPVPVGNCYATPETLGKDRLAAAVGANFLQPNKDILVIDAGTAITFNLIDSEANYRGGTISLGLRTRFRALHEFTGKLPLIEIAENETFPFIGNDTRTGIAAGVLNGIIFEIDTYIDLLKKEFPTISVFLTGGDAFFLENRLKNRTFAESFLVLIGLNRILNYNAKK